MYRLKDFYYKNIYEMKNKKIGIVEDIFIDFFNGKMIGIKISNTKFFSKNNYVAVEDIIEFGKDIIVKKVLRKESLSFNDIKSFEVIDAKGNVKGVLEDIIINKNDYYIRGLIISPGIIDKFIRGKEVILIDNCILGEKYILYTKEDKIQFKTMPHEVEENLEFKKV